MLDRLHESKGLMELEVLVESDAWEVVVVVVTLLTSLGWEIYSLCIGRSYIKFVGGKLSSTSIPRVFTRKPVVVIWMIRTRQFCTTGPGGIGVGWVPTWPSQTATLGLIPPMFVSSMTIPSRSHQVKY